MLPNQNTWFCRKTCSSARERAVFLPGKACPERQRGELEAGDIGFIVDTTRRTTLLPSCSPYRGSNAEQLRKRAARSQIEISDRLPGVKELLTEPRRHEEAIAVAVFFLFSVSLCLRERHHWFRPKAGLYYKVARTGILFQIMSLMLSYPFCHQLLSATLCLRHMYGVSPQS